jgi:predicted aspartyl protease
MGGRHFTVLCTLSKNRYRITLSALIDSGANGFVFIDTAYANNISTFLNLKPEPLIQPIIPKGFNGQPSKAVTHMLTLHLSLNGQRQEDIPFMILDLGNHDVILGLKWMSYFNVWLKPRDKRLMWPDEPKHATPPLFQREILVPRTTLRHGKIQPKHQQDVYARDQAFTLKDQRRQDGRQSTPAIQVITGPEQLLTDRTPPINMSLAPALAVTTRRTHDQDIKRQL